jgi:membrane-anchored protein YejM (alkaline phosphatase superfamily)
MLLYELFTGKAVVRGSRELTRHGNPFRYWFWVLFHAAVLSVLIFAWASGIQME